MKHFKNLGLGLVAVLALTSLFGVGTASATTLTVGGVAKNSSVAMEISLKSGTSTIFKDKNGTTNDTCTGSNGSGSTESPFTGGSVWLTWVSWSFNICSHTTHIIKVGRLHITWTSGSNGTISMSGSEWTIKSTVFGVTATCKTGSGTTIGTLTGVSSGAATMDINATTMDCGALGTSSWTGTYTVTSPSGLGVAS